MKKNIESVDEFVLNMNHPQIEIIQLVREIIKQTGDNLLEGIKWNAPSYSLNGNDIITLNFHSKEYVTIVFHTGPKGKDTHTKRPLFIDETNLLEWQADKRAVIKLQTLSQLEKDQDNIKKIIRLWIEKAINSFEY